MLCDLSVYAAIQNNTSDQALDCRTSSLRSESPNHFRIPPFRRSTVVAIKGVSGVRAGSSEQFATSIDSLHFSLSSSLYTFVCNSHPWRFNNSCTFSSWPRPIQLVCITPGHDNVTRNLHYYCYGSLTKWQNGIWKLKMVVIGSHNDDKLFAYLSL